MTPDSTQVAAPAMDTLRVLVANSNGYSRSILRMALRAIAIRDVVEASDAPTALRVALGRRIDVAILEQDSLGLDGASLAREIRRAAVSVSRTPIVMVASQANAATVTAARDSGVNAFLLRPISAATVKSRIVAALTDRRPFVVGVGYVGPDRRFKATAHGFPPRRFNDDTLTDLGRPPDFAAGR